MNLHKLLLLWLTLQAGGSAYACSQLPSGTAFWVRLDQPVSSYSAKPGMAVSGFLLESPTCDGSPVFPIKLPVEGRVVAVHKVGIGLVHETASLQIEFVRLMPRSGLPIAIRGELDTVANARESVRNGTLRGIRSTETPQGRITSRLKYLPSLHLYPDPGLMCFKLLFPIFPEPEIYLPAGTDLRIRLKDALDLPPDLEPVAQVPQANPDETDEVDQVLSSLPRRTVDKNFRDADLIDIAFVASREQLEGAFRVAGWKPSDPVSRHTVLREFHAFLAQTNDPTAPMSRQSLDGHLPELSLERTFDSYEKRDHLRIWHVGETENQIPIWASAAVQEKGATLSITNRGFIHHVSENLDEERDLVLRELGAADCISSVAVIRRSAGERVFVNATGELLRSDGNITMVHLRDCSGDMGTPAGTNAVQFRPRTKLTRYLRRQVLTVRSDLLRANCVYAAFDLGQITIRALRGRRARRSEITLALSHAQDAKCCKRLDSQGLDPSAQSSSKSLPVAFEQ